MKSGYTSHSLFLYFLFFSFFSPDWLFSREGSGWRAPLTLVCCLSFLIASSWLCSSPSMLAISRGVFARQGEVQDRSPAVPGPAQPCSSAAASPGEEAEVGQKEGHPQKKSMQGIRHPDTNTNTQPACLIFGSS